MDEEEEPRPTALQRVRVALWAVLGLLVAGGIVMMIVTVLGHGGNQRHTITTVTRILLPPPPPPPPPPKPKEPPPEKQVEKIEEPKPVKEPPKPKEAPKPKAAPAPPGQKLTAEAGAGANPYGLGVGNGGGDTVGGGGGSSAAYSLYAELIQSQVQAALKRDQKTRYGRFRIGLRIAVSPSGQITNASVISSSGDPAVDSAVMRLLDGLSLGQAPPAGVASNINVRVTAIPG